MAHAVPSVEQNNSEALLLAMVEYFQTSQRALERMEAPAASHAYSKMIIRRQVVQILPAQQSEGVYILQALEVHVKDLTMYIQLWHADNAQRGQVLLVMCKCNVR